MTQCAPTDRLMQTLKVEAPGATDAVIQLHLFNVMDEFFRRTSAWRYETEIALEEGQTEYGLAIPVDAQVVRTLGVGHNGSPVPAATTGGATISSLGVVPPELTFVDGDSRFSPDVTDLEPTTGVFSYAIYRPNYITTTAPPDAEMVKYPLNVLLALTISKSCLECDCGDWSLEEWMYDMFFQDWLDGTLARLFAMPSKPWTNKEMMVYHGKRFRNAMAFRKQEAPRGFSWGVPGWRFPRGGWVG